jgi:ParB-like chromosome segregation protein Spo0J
MDVHRISADSPDMSDSERTALRDSIAAIGQQVPILIWRGDVIDGRKRLAACQSLGIDPITHTVPDESDPATFAHALNILRTHYTPGQRSMYAERLATATKADGPRRRWVVEGGIQPSTTTTTEAATRLGVTKSQVVAARRIRRTAAPEVTQAVERGALTLHAAQAIATKVPHAEQAEAVERVVAAKKGKRNTTAKILNVAAPGLKRTNRRDVDRVRERALSTMHECAAGLDQFMEHGFGPEADIEQWSKWAAEIITTLRTFTKRLEATHERTA